MPRGIFLHKPHSEETKRRMSQSRKGRICSLGTRKKISEANKGWISPITIEASAKKRRGVKYSQERIEAMRYLAKGMVNSGQFKSEDMMGEKHWNWKGGTSKSNAKLRSGKDYRNWRKEVAERDGWKCTQCGSTTKLEADHIKPFILFPELRFDLSNGRLLCRECHKKTPTYAAKIRTYKINA